MRYFFAAAVLLAASTSAMAQGSVVSTLTRGTAVMTVVSGPYQPGDPYRGETVISIINTLPPNPIKDIVTDPIFGDGGTTGAPGQ